MNGWSVFLSLTQTAEIAIFTFPGILCLAECFFLAEYLLQESVQPFAKLVFEESEVVDRYLGLSRRSRQLRDKGALMKAHFHFIDAHRKEWLGKYKTFNTVVMI